MVNALGLEPSDRTVLRVQFPSPKPFYQGRLVIATLFYSVFFGCFSIKRLPSAAFKAFSVRGVSVSFRPL